MPAPNLLVMSHKITGPSGLALGFMSGGTTFNSLSTNPSGSSDVTSENWTTTPYLGHPCNRVVWYRGMYYSHVIGHNGPQQWAFGVFDPIIARWDSYTTNQQPADYVQGASCPGIYVVGDRLFTIVHGSSGHPYIRRTDDGDTITDTVINATNDYYGKAGRGVLYRNQLFFPCSGGASSIAFCVFDPTALTTTFLTYASLGWTAGSPTGSLCVFRNRLYLLRKDTFGVSTTLKLYEFTGGTFVVRATLQAAATLNESATLYNRSDGYLFPVGDTKLVAISPIDTGASAATRGTRAWDLTSTGPTTFTVLDITSTLIPTSLRNTADGGTGITPETYRWTGFVDNDFNTTPGAPQVYIWLLSDQAVGGSHSYYEYVSSVLEIGPGSPSLSASFTLPYQSTGGGDRTYATGILKARTTSVAASPSLGRMRLTAAVYGETDGAYQELSANKLVFAGRRNPCRAATTGALPTVVAAAQTLTGSVNGALPLQDGVSLLVGQRLLVKNQAAPAQNGVFDVTVLGDGLNPFILTRSSDCNTANVNTGLGAGAWVLVTEGTQANTGWFLRLSLHAITFNTTGLPWLQISAIDRRLRVWYSDDETPNMVQATFAGTPTQNFVQTPTVTRNGNALENVVADGRTIYTFDWDAFADLLQSGQPVNYMTRPGAS